MEDYVLKIVGWIYDNYGRVGCAVAFLMLLTVLTLVYVFLNRLPESNAFIPENKKTDTP